MVSNRVYRAIAVVLFLLTGVSTGARAASVIRVPADQATIQAAIQAAVNGDTVQVAPGYYIENVNFLGKAIRVVSEQGPQATTIDGNKAGPVASLVSGETAQAVLSGFTLKNGQSGGSSGYRGGGVRIQNSSPTITGNIITDNNAGDGGGGISSSFGSPLIQGNLISSNRQTPGFSGGVGGGGVSIIGASLVQLIGNTIIGNSWSTASGGGVSLFAAGAPTIKNNFIQDNSAYSQGGGIALLNNSDALIVQNVVTGNSAGAGGGIYWLVPSGSRGPLLVNNTITGNSSTQGSAIFADGFDGQAQLINNILTAFADHIAVVCGNLDGGSTPIFRFNDVISDSGTSYAGTCTNQTGANGNISLYPLFTNAAGGDYHLQPASPAIDAGDFHSDSQTDMEGVNRPIDGNADGVAAYDMGAYEAPAIDYTAPITAATFTPSPNSAGWNRTNTTVTLTATDNASGVQAIRYALSGAQTSSVVNGANPSSVTISAEGSTNVDYSAVDNAGNTEVWKSLRVNLDKSNPVISGMPAGCTLSPPKHQLVQVATVTATDAQSGVAQLTVTAVSSEPDTGVGGGDVPQDIVINGGVVQLRAERAPNGKGRTYTITATAVDIAGNSITVTATCSVPK